MNPRIQDRPVREADALAATAHGASDTGTSQGVGSVEPTPDSDSGPGATPPRYRLDGVDWSDEFGYVRAMYDVPAKRGMRVIANGKPGRITSGAGHRIRVRLDGERHSGFWHPTWRMEYLT